MVLSKGSTSQRQLIYTARNKSRYGDAATTSLLPSCNLLTPGKTTLSRNPAFDSRYKYVPKDALPLSEVLK
jgi:hypothetical protein